MKRLLALLIIAGLAYGGYVYYRQSRLTPQFSRLPISGGVTLKPPTNSWQNLESVLGTSISRGVAAVTNLANDATDGAAEPLINKAIADLQQKIKDVPHEQAEKIQYNYCKTVVTEYENN